MDDYNNNGIYDSDEFAKIYLSVFGDQVPGIAEEPQEYAEEEYFDESPEEYSDDYSEEDNGYATEAPQTDSEDLEFNPGFKLGSRKNYGYSYDGHAVNTGADVNYNYSQAPSYDELKSSYEGSGAYYPSEDLDYEDDKGKGRKKLSIKDKLQDKKEEKKEKKARKKAEELENEAVSSPEDDYSDFDEGIFDDYSGSAIDKAYYVPSSFKQFISAKFTGLFLRLRGGVPTENTNDTDELDSDGLGQEVAFMQGSKFYGSQVHSLQLRFRISLLLFLIQVYLSLGLPAPGMLGSLPVATAGVMAIQLTIMLLSLDVFTNGILNAFRGRFGADTLVSIACILTTLDALMVIYSNVGIHMPLCVASSFSMIGLLFSTLLSARGLRKAMRVPAIGKKVYTVTGEAGVTAKESTILKSSRPATGFIRRCEEAPPDEELYSKISPALIVVSLLLALVICALKKDFSGLLFVFSALLSPLAPFGALLCFAYPFFTASMKLFQSGAALAGWSGVLDVGKSKNLIITDRDLFPEECIEIENVRIFADYDSDSVISYAGTMIINSGCGLASAFGKLMEENHLELLKADNYEFLPGGGMKAMIEGHVIVCGNSDLMRLMDIKIPYRLITGTSVLLAIDGVLYGIFNITYFPDPKVRKALVSLMRSSRHPIFAIRDFNITPEMIRDYFDVATDGYDFPPYVERYTLSEAKPAKDSKIAAVICREGLGSLISMADGGRSVYLVSNINLTITVLLSIAGFVAVFLRMLIGGAIGAGFVLLFMVTAAVPVVVLGILTLQIN